MYKHNGTRIDLKMLLLGFFVLPMFFVTGRELTINNYIVKINDGILKNVEPIIGEPPVELDLSGLGLKNIDKVAFRNATNLMKLNLANNSLTEFPSDRLKLLVNLKNLSVANNCIKRMPLDYVRLDHLEVVDLSNNLLFRLNDLGNYGRGRCDFIVKGSRITQISHTDSLSRRAVPTPKPLVPVVLSMFTKCRGWGPSFHVQDFTNANVTLSDEKIKCPKFNEPLAMYLRNSHALDTIPQIEVCIENGKMQRASMLSAGSAVSKDCKIISNPDAESSLELGKMGIENFARAWYRVGTIPYYSIDLSFNKITSFTNNLLNNLPESVKHVRLSGNKIKRLDAGIIQNEFLMYLDLSDNGLHKIQFNALDRTNLSGLILARNEFTDTRFVERLPSSLTELYLNGNKISQVSDNSFSKLNNLFYLDLSSNKITQLGSKSLRGLSSLQWLYLSGNGLQNIESGAFRDLGELREFNLKNNNMTEFKKSVFFDLRELILLNINGNNLKRVTKDTFKGLPDNLRDLELSNNGIESLEKGSFVRVPKYNLELNANEISKIEKGDINIPSLTNLYLDENKLTEIKEENFDLPSLEVLQFNRNLVRKIEKGAFRKLRNLEVLDISRNPITTLQKGSLFGMKLHTEIHTINTNLELIQGGAFFDE